MTEDIARRLIPIFKADYKRARRQLNECYKNGNPRVQRATYGRLRNKLLQYLTTKQVLIECYDTLKLN